MRWEEIGATTGECHLKVDLLLIYRRKPDVQVLQLVRLGSHSELFG
jgi:mRNA interferase YafQ